MPSTALWTYLLGQVAAFVSRPLYAIPIVASRFDGLFPTSMADCINLDRSSEKRRSAQENAALDPADFEKDFSKLLELLTITRDNLKDNLHLAGMEDERNASLQASDKLLDILYMRCFSSNWQDDVQNYQERQRLTIGHLLTSMLSAAVNHVVFAKGSEWQRVLSRQIQMSSLPGIRR